MLTPWPSETVYDLDTQEITPAADTNWIEAGNVEFPWDNFSIGYARSLALGNSDGTPEQVQAAAAAVAQLPPDPGTSWLFPALAVSALLAISLAYLLIIARRRRLWPRARSRSSGFTLVELLVVIGIIALLLSLILPALGSARRTARATHCLAQVREVGHFMALYANDHNGRLYPKDIIYPPGQHVQTRLHLLLPEDVQPNLLLCPTAHLEWERLSYILNVRNGV